MGREDEARPHQRHDRHDLEARHPRQIGIEKADRLDIGLIEPGFLARFAQGGGQRIPVVLIDLAARKGDLPGMARQMIGALGEKHRELGLMQHDGDQHGGRTPGLKRIDGFHIGIEVVVAAHR